jgi:hypothetical protein
MLLSQPRSVVLSGVLPYLSGRSLMALSQTSKSWNYACLKQHLWSNVSASVSTEKQMNNFINFLTAAQTNKLTKVRLEIATIDEYVYLPPKTIESVKEYELIIDADDDAFNYRPALEFSYATFPCVTNFSISLTHGFSFFGYPERSMNVVSPWKLESFTFDGEQQKIDDWLVHSLFAATKNLRNFTWYSGNFETFSLFEHFSATHCATVEKLEMGHMYSNEWMYRLTIPRMPSLRVLTLELHGYLFDLLWTLGPKVDSAPPVEEMHVSAHGISVTVLGDCIQMDKVKKLHFTDAIFLNVTFFECLPRLFPAIEHLTLSRSHTTDGNFAMLSQSTSLRTIVVENVTGCTGLFLALADFSHLSSIAFKNCPDLAVELIPAVDYVVMQE